MVLPGAAAASKTATTSSSPKRRPFLEEAAAGVVRPLPSPTSAPLGQRPPHEVYTPSHREMSNRVEEPWYDADHQVRRVRSSGEIMWKGERIFVTEALIGELVGIAELETGDHVVRFCGRDIGLIDRSGRFLGFAPPRFGLCQADTGSLVGTVTSGESGARP
jgi:hypothetical protein